MTTVTVNAGSTSFTTDNPQFAAVVLQMISEEPQVAEPSKIDGVPAIGTEWPGQAESTRASCGVVTAARITT
ncbi:hypothetical protein [Pseudomonas nitroreducens]|uniref:hypothetical protein n=1 Tax=Pseudomonas nitroreducens TaxID=46680 RepID=UPI0012FEDE40